MIFTSRANPSNRKLALVPAKMTCHDSFSIATNSERTGRVGLGYSHGWLPDMEPEPNDRPRDALLNGKAVVCPVQDGAPRLTTVGTSPPRWS